MFVFRLITPLFFVVAVVHLVRHFVADERRMGLAAWGAAFTALLAGLSGAVAIGVPHNVASAGKLAFVAGGSLLLAGALWVAIYSGMLLGDKQGGYWTKGTGGGWMREAMLWGGLSLAGLLLYSTVLVLQSGVPLRVEPMGSGRVALGLVLTSVTYSLGEEFFYRGCVQALLTSWLGNVSHGKWWAIGITTALFVAQHVDPIHPAFRYLSVVPMGIVLGLLFARFGLVASIIIHAGFNMLATFLLPHLI